MGEFVSGILADKKELFYLQNGRSIASLRELEVSLKNMDDATFFHHVREEKNDFSMWVKDVFKDSVLAKRIAPIKDRLEMSRLVEERILEHEQKDLKKFGVHVPKEDLKPLEEYIENQLALGYNPEAIRERLLNRNWKEVVIDLVLEVKDNAYEKFKHIEDIEKLEDFHTKLELLKKQIISAAAQGSSLEHIKKSLKRNKWHEDIIDFVFYDVYKPHPNIKKLGQYIIHQVRDKNKSVDKVRKTLLHLGWQDYLIDYVMYGVHKDVQDVSALLNYLDHFGKKEEREVKTFLLKMGWSEDEVKQALEKKELEMTKQRLRKDLNLNVGLDIREAAKSVSSTIFEIEDAKLWKKILEDYDQYDLKDFYNDHGELHMSSEYSYCYAQKDVDKVSKETKIQRIYFSSETKPLLVKTDKKYIILPKIIKRKCVVTGKKYPVTEMKRVEMWDASRTRKVTRYVSLGHEEELKTLLASTRITQS